MKLDKNQLLLYAVTDRKWSKNLFDFYQQVEYALYSGVTILQLREKNISENDFINEAKEIKKICNKYSIPLIINDNLNVALASNADGLHIGQHDINAKYAKSKIGENLILGVSVQNLNQALIAQKNGANYLGVGAVFSTNTKSDAENVSTIELEKICQNMKIPVCAIGGITLNNMSKLANTGISGVAIVSEIFGNNNIKQICNNLYQKSFKLFGSKS